MTTRTPTNFKRASDFISTHAKEAVKQYITYDASLRMEYTYTTTIDAAHGDPCLKTQYTYESTSTRISKMKESLTTWDSSWDI